MDLNGQKLAETLCMYLVMAAALLGFAVGFLRHDFSQMMAVFTGGVGLAAAATVPDWPVFNRHPIKWLPPKEATEQQQQRQKGGSSGRKKKTASWCNLWGMF